MGSTRWSDEHHEHRARLLSAAGRDAFEHDEDVRQGRAARGVHQKMNPLGVAARESRDSAAHPESHAVEALIGDTLQADVPTAELVAELTRRWDTYFVVPRMTNHWNNESVRRRWVDLLGQNVLRLEEPAGICELIASAVGLAEGKVGWD